MSRKHADSSRAGVRRRDFLVGGAGAVAASASRGLINPTLASADGGASPHGDPEGPSVNGTLRETQGGNTLVFVNCHLDLPEPPPGVPTLDTGEIPVTLAENAELWRIGPATLADFQAGDKLLAYVEWEEGELVAKAIVPLYQSIEATVEAVNGDELRTSAGTVVINQYTHGALPEKPVEEVAEGDRIGATCMQDSSSGIYYAGNLVVLS